MKPLFFFLFAVLTVAVHAEPYVYPSVHYSTVPVREAVTVFEMPVYFGERMVIPEPYAVEKPTEKAVAIPKPLAPLLPLQEEIQIPATVRGQTQTVDNLAEMLDSPLPLPQGAVEEGTIDSKLIETSESSESDFDILGHNFIQAGGTGQSTKPADPVGYGVLLTIMVVIIIGLVYMVFVAYDYRQRWMQSLTMQNDRYLGGALDFDTEDTYGSAVVFPENFGLTRRSSI